MLADMKLRDCLVLLLALSLLTSCRSAYYSTWEKFGVYKRDLLKKRVVAARDDQKAAGEQFKDALTKIKELYGFEGGDLEKVYNSLNQEYQQSSERAKTVNKRIKDVETVAGDLFAEWEKELEQISTSSLRADSRQKLQDTRRRYEELHAALKRAENSMEPVLVRLKDQVLYLKHNLNAAAVSSLKGESTNIQAEITKLLNDMNAAISQADKFISTLQ
jgi:hypothetical protein